MLGGVRVSLELGLILQVQNITSHRFNIVGGEVTGKMICNKVSGKSLQHFVVPGDSLEAFPRSLVAQLVEVNKVYQAEGNVLLCFGHYMRHHLYQFSGSFLTLSLIPLYTSLEK